MTGKTILEMHEAQAREILREWIQPDGHLCFDKDYIGWRRGQTNVTLEGEFSASELEAIVWWMRNKGKP